MIQKDNRYLLNRNESILTVEEKDAYLLRTGSVAVFIVPWENEETGRRIRLYSMSPGDVVPSFVYRDMDYKHWRFLLVAEEEADVELLPSWVTSVLKHKFAQKASLGDLKNETFENSVVEFYKKEIVKDAVFIERGKKGAPNIKKESLGVIHSAFGSGIVAVNGNDEVYRAVAMAASALKQEILSEEEVSRICGEDLEIPDVADAFGLICRNVVLEEKWFEVDCGVLIGKIEEEQVVLYPKRFGYNVLYVSTGKEEKLTPKLAEQVDPRCFSIARAMPSKSMSLKELIRFGLHEVPISDFVAVVLLGLTGVLIGVLIPSLNQKVYDDYIPLGDFSGLIQICAVISSFMVGNLFFSIMKSLCEFRISSRVGYRMQSALYHRAFRLPEYFFHDYDSADFAERLMSFSNLANGFTSAALLTGVSSVLSLFYLIRMFKYSAKLTWYSLLMIFISSAIVVPLSFIEAKYEKKTMAQDGAASSKLYQYINGIEKIRMAGVEDRAIYEYMVPFSKSQSIEIKKNKIVAFRTVISSISATVFSMVLYFVVVKSKVNVTMGSFIGFNTAMGSFSGAMQNLTDKLISIYQLKPSFDRIKGVFETACEDDSGQEKVEDLRGEVSVHHVTFSYTAEQKPILDDFSLDIKPGEYIGIVGASGCGKSTLLKLLLGFETPKTGQVCYDGHDLKSVSKQSLRKNLGVVLQNGQLISGSIYENITIAEPKATLKEVQQAIEAVGLKDDIKQMPMGIHTMLSDNSNTISGGQQQRILIARAIIRKPKILIFDEATSALDNITQAAVSKSLDQMHSTRIVVAHRLSTIKNCDRIIVIDHGTISEEGNYETLMAKKGLFYQLASRQIAE